MRVKGVAIVLAWALAHHMLAGTRHLLSDIDIGSQLPAARRSAWIVNLGGVGVALLAAGMIAVRKTVTGLRAWLVQRLSAVYMLLFILFFLSHFVLDPPRSFMRIGTAG